MRWTEKMLSIAVPIEAMPIAMTLPAVSTTVLPISMTPTTTERTTESMNAWPKEHSEPATAFHTTVAALVMALVTVETIAARWKWWRWWLWCQ